MTVTVALAGDTMLGRGVAAALEHVEPASIVSPRLADLTRAADLFVLNLECCVSERGAPWPDPSKPFFFRAPPIAVRLLVHLGVSCVTLANNHALDFGEEALLDTLNHLRGAGIASVGAGADLEAARAPTVLEARGFRLGVFGVTDHPAGYAATPSRGGVAYADLGRGVPHWLSDGIGSIRADAVLVSPHWGPNMTSAPVPYVRAAAEELVGAGATLLAGHSAHVFHGVNGRILYDLGDFLDDYATDPLLRNDLGLVFFVTFHRSAPPRVEALPIKIDYCATDLAAGEEASWIADRFRSACRVFGADVRANDEGWLDVENRRT
jgi:poly-gamma-glutamate capsule biosynthesis protein CapA/YwtB (metallophosphatase superfamily)